MTPVLDIRGLTKSYGARTLFRGVDLSVARGEKVGVIGPNGSGKSTLFRILAGLEGPDEGTLALSRGATVGYLPQEPEMDPERTIFETAAEARHDLPHPVPDWDWTHRVEAILTRLGIDGWERPTGGLSGGERRRVALARALLSEPDLLLLDEPTNHLDADTVLWLEETLYDFTGAVLVVTHDRYFLDRVVDRMIEVAPDGFRSYDGGYTEYLEARTARQEQDRTEEAKRVKLLEKELAWARRSPPARTGKQKARRERAREMARAQDVRDRSRPRQVELEVTDAPRLGRTVLEFHEVSKAFGEQPLIEGFSDRLSAGERIGVVGPNGSGKTTLLRIAVGEEEPDEGRVVWGENTRIGYFDQERELDPDLTVARAVADADWVEVGGRRVHLVGYLERFLFAPHVQRQKVSALSGGERSRVLLARLFLEEFNLLVMDEPTNDLDLDTLRILEDAIEGFEGCVLLVTHDRFLLDKAVTSLLVFEGDGRVTRHHGSWDRYLARREEEEAAREARRKADEKRHREERAAAARDQAKEARTGKKRLSFHEQRELDGMEERIAGLEEEKEALAHRLADPAFYAAEGKGDGDEVTRVTRRFQEVEAELEALYERWMELEEMAG